MSKIKEGKENSKKGTEKVGLIAQAEVEYEAMVDEVGSTPRKHDLRQQVTNGDAREVLIRM